MHVFYSQYTKHRKILLWKVHLKSMKSSHAIANGRREQLSAAVVVEVGGNGEVALRNEKRCREYKTIFMQRSPNEFLY